MQKENETLKFLRFWSINEKHFREEIKQMAIKKDLSIKNMKNEIEVLFLNSQTIISFRFIGAEETQEKRRVVCLFQYEQEKQISVKPLSQDLMFCLKKKIRKAQSMYLNRKLSFQSHF